MNRKFLSIIMASALALSLLGCGAEEEKTIEEVPSEVVSQTAANEESKELTGDEVYAKMAEVSRLSNLAKKYKAAALETVNYIGTGEEITSQVYKDEERVILDYPVEDVVIENGRVYLMNSEDGFFAEYFYPGEAYTSLVAPYEDFALYSPNEGTEEIDSCELKDGKYTIRSHELSKDNAVMYGNMFGYDGNISGLKYEYIIDSETFEIIESGATLTFEDGSEKLFAHDTAKKGMEKLTVPEDIHSKIFSGEKRTITFFEDAETSYTLEASKGVPVIIIPAYEGEFELYLDSEFTNKLRQGTDFDNDMTVYLKKL